MATFNLTKKYQIFKVFDTVDAFEAMPTEWDTYEEAETFLFNAIALGAFSSLYKYVILQTHTILIQSLLCTTIRNTTTAQLAETPRELFTLPLQIENML